MPDTNGYLVDIILPKHEVHLLAGPSGAGKTRWLLHNLLLWEQGQDFLGFKSHPVPWVYIAADRSVASVERTLTSMGIQPGLITAIPAWDEKMCITEIFDSITKSKAKLVVWEAFGSFVEHPQTSNNVKKLVQRVCEFCREKNLTVIAVVESPKMKPYERYENPRQRVSGAAAWGHFSETIFLVEPDKVGEPDCPDRTLYVCPRNSPGMKLPLAFDLDGRLLPVEDASQFLERRNKSNGKSAHP